MLEAVVLCVLETELETVLDWLVDCVLDMELDTVVLWVVEAVLETELEAVLDTVDEWVDVTELDKELEEVERDVADMVFNDLVTELAMEWMYALEYEERMDAKRAEQKQASASSQAP